MKRIKRDEFLKIKYELINKIKHLNPVFCYLFGSFARGDYHFGSDIDILIVMDTPHDWFERTVNIKKYLDDLNLPIELSIEPYLYTVKEFEALKRDKNPFIEQIIKEGELIYG